MGGGGFASVRVDSGNEPVCFAVRRWIYVTQQVLNGKRPRMNYNWFMSGFPKSLLVIVHCGL
jgi:hypothetical protein